MNPANLKLKKSDAKILFSWVSSTYQRKIGGYRIVLCGLIDSRLIVGNQSLLLGAKPQKDIMLDF